jgi:hypothetical protein
LIKKINKDRITMANESAYPLYWPRGRARTPAGQRSADAPFTVGESYTTNKQEYRDGQTHDVAISRRRSKAVSVSIAVDRLEDQLERLGAQAIVLSTNLELRLNGQPRAGQRDPEDPGAAVWFNLNRKRMVLACDKWVRVADNIAALAAHIRSIRSVENYGVGTMEQAFAGYRALEDFSGGDMPWKRVLGFGVEAHPTLAEVESKYRTRMKEIHPDMSGQSGLQAAQLNVAITQARAELS